jgi:hypothetical protein
MAVTGERATTERVRRLLVDITHIMRSCVRWLMHLTRHIAAVLKAPAWGLFFASVDTEIAPC